jgi:hypothetical protein
LALKKQGRGVSAKKAGFPTIAHLPWQEAEEKKILLCFFHSSLVTNTANGAAVKKYRKKRKAKGCQYPFVILALQGKRLITNN